MSKIDSTIYSKDILRCTKDSLRSFLGIQTTFNESREILILFQLSFLRVNFCYFLHKRIYGVLVLLIIVTQSGVLHLLMIILSWFKYKIDALYLFINFHSMIQAISYTFKFFTIIMIQTI